MARSIELHGHRGARGLFPENTLVGFSAVLAIGVDALELDVAMTVDGVVVVTHDPQFNPDVTRTADGAWLAEPGPPIRSLPAAQLVAFDVGRIRPGSAYAARVSRSGAARWRAHSAAGRCAPAGSHRPIQHRAEDDSRSVPSLTIDGARMADAVVAAADAAGAANRLIVQSFDWRGPRHLRRARPDMRLAWLTRAAILRRCPRYGGMARIPATSAVGAACGGRRGRSRLGSRPP